VQKLKVLHGSGITALDELAGEIDMNSRTTFERLNSQIQSHTSALENVSSFPLA
jgi:kinesin family member 11